MKYINEIIMRYKRIRNRQHLKNIYSNEIYLLQVAR